MIEKKIACKNQKDRSFSSKGKFRTPYKFASHSRAPFRLWNFVIFESWNIEHLVQRGFVAVNMSGLP